MNQHIKGTNSTVYVILGWVCCMKLIQYYRRGHFYNLSGFGALIAITNC